MELHKYWFIENKYPEVREYLAEKYKVKGIIIWRQECVGFDGCSYHNECHGAPRNSFYNDAKEITIEQFREMTNQEPSYEIY